MHTSNHTMPPHVLERNGCFYFNRRVPKHAVQAFGSMIRLKLSNDPEESIKMALGFGKKLDALWSQPDCTRSVDLRALLEASRPRPQTLSAWAEEYVSL